MLRPLRTWLRQRPRGSVWTQPGHYYSPILGPSDIAARRDPDAPTADVAIDDDLLWERLAALGPVCRALDLSTAAPYAANDMYAAGDAAVYYGMIRTHRPRRIVEVGSGYSTAIAVAATHGLPTSITTIDPDPARLEILGLRAHPRVSVRTERVQNTPLELFAQLEAGDFLFLDTSHVAKTGSGVLWDFFEIIPRLAPGVLVTFTTRSLDSSIRTNGWSRADPETSCTCCGRSLPSTRALRCSFGPHGCGGWTEPAPSRACLSSLATRVGRSGFG